MLEARQGYRLWSHVPAGNRAACLERAAKLIESEAPALLGLLQVEGGKTIEDAIGEWREAIDFCRYYAQEARRLFGKAEVMPGPAGEDNRLECFGRGVFVCISPWNFPPSFARGRRCWCGSRRFAGHSGGGIHRLGRNSGGNQPAACD